MKLACIIVTKDRPVELARCIASLQAQTEPADQLIVVDANATGVVGITKQRNYGRAQVAVDTDVVLYVDDDIELAPTALAETRKVFASQAEVIGVTGNMQEPYHISAIKRQVGHYLMLVSDQPYGLTCGMFNTIYPITVVTNAMWLPGAFMAFRWQAVRDVAFDEWFAGYGLGEDLDFSLAVKKRGKFVASPAIQITHHHSDVGRDWVKFGYMRIRNRKYLRDKYFGWSWRHRVSYHWANFWLLLFNCVRAPLSKRHRQELMGELKALLRV